MYVLRSLAALASCYLSALLMAHFSRQFFPTSHSVKAEFIHSRGCVTPIRPT